MSKQPFTTLMKRAYVYFMSGQLILLLASPVFAATCDYAVRHDEYYNLTDLGLSGKFQALTVEQLRTMAASKLPMDPYADESGRVTNIHFKQRFAQLVNDPKVLELWPNTRDRLQKRLALLEKDQTLVEGGREHTRHILSPKMIFETNGYVDLVETDSGEVLLAYTDSSSGKTMLTVKNLLTGATEPILELPLLEARFWVPAWHRESNGELALWVATSMNAKDEDSPRLRKFVITKIDWKTKIPSDHPLSWREDGAEVKGWYSIPGHRLFLWTGFSYYEMNGHSIEDAAPLTDQAALIDHTGKAYLVINRHKGIADLSKRGLMPDEPVDNLKTGGNASLFESKAHDRYLAYFNGGDLTVQIKSGSKTRSLDIMTPLGVQPSPAFHETADGKILLAVAHGVSGNLQAHTGLNVFDLSQPKTPILQRWIKGAVDNVKLRWLNDAYGRTLLAASADKIAAEVSFFHPETDHDEAKFEIGDELKNWFHVGGQYYFWTKDLNGGRARVYRAFSEGAAE